MKLSQKEKDRLKKKYGEWALVTGASSGIGKELAYRVAEAGLHLIITGRHEDKLTAIRQEIQSLYGVNVEMVVADLADQGIEQVWQAAQQKPIGLLIASAGFGTSGAFLNTSIHAEVNMLQVNCLALLQLTHHFAQKFAAQKKGGIILMSSIVSFQGVPFAANYAASKAYVQTLAEALYHELKPYNVDVLSAAPGPVQTGFSERANMVMDNTLTPDQIGVPILKALGRKATVLPGFLSKLLVYSLGTVPRWGKIRIMKGVMGGMTKHQRA